jgi:hypothetical protein
MNFLKYLSFFAFVVLIVYFGYNVLSDSFDGSSAFLKDTARIPYSIGVFLFACTLLGTSMRLDYKQRHPTLSKSGTSDVNIVAISQRFDENQKTVEGLATEILEVKKRVKKIEVEQQETLDLIHEVFTSREELPYFTLPEKNKKSNYLPLPNS